MLHDDPHNPLQLILEVISWLLVTATHNKEHFITKLLVKIHFICDIILNDFKSAIWNLCQPYQNLFFNHKSELYNSIDGHL